MIDTKRISVTQLRIGDRIVTGPRRTQEVSRVETGSFCHNIHINGSDCYDRIAIVTILNVGRIVATIAHGKTTEEIEIIEWDSLSV